MQANVIMGQTPFSVIGSPVIADGETPSLATLSSTSYTSSDPTVFTVAPSTSVPNGAVITVVGPGSATLTETATAMEINGTTEQIQGVATIVVAAAPPPPPPPAASIVFTFGLPSTTPAT